MKARNKIKTTVIARRVATGQSMNYDQALYLDVNHGLLRFCLFSSPSMESETVKTLVTSWFKFFYSSYTNP